MGREADAGGEGFPQTLLRIFPLLFFKENLLYHRALRLIRVYHDLSQAQLAEKIGISKSYISELERGHKKASIDILEKYASFFRIPLSSLLLFAEESAKPDFVEKSRVAVANKVLKMLDWLATVSDTEKNE